MTKIQLLLLSFPLISAGIFSLYKSKFLYTLFCIVALSALLKIYCSSDQYLHEWDERCHALVAKNMIQHPLKPTLYENPVEPYDHKNWIGNHIWLMKPPIPLWGMAISMHTFGISEYSVRIPGILYALGAIILTFLIARKLFNTPVALIASFLHGIHGMLTDLSSGRLSSDGVESCFLFFVELGIYTVLMKNRGEYRQVNYLLTGFVTGLAILCKWQPALLVLIVMFLYHWDPKRILRHILLSGMALLVAILVFAPWGLFILNNYPVEARWILLSIFTPMVTSGVPQPTTWYSLLTDFGNIFGYTTYLIATIAITTSFRDKNFKLFALLVYSIFPLIIFSLAVVKRGPYIFIGAPGIFILIGWLMTNAGNILYQHQKIIRVIGVISILFICGYSLEKLYLFQDQKRTKDWCEKIKVSDYETGSIVYNESHYLELMFYKQDVTAYPFSKK
jgi:4-amino-4-deoxy-L-arabinose transferase-like glycosyltransferase